jgi:hypothetical protein
LALKQFYIKNVGPAKNQRVQQKIPGCWTYVQQNENKFQKVCQHLRKPIEMLGLDNICKTRCVLSLINPINKMYAMLASLEKKPVSN